MQKIIALLRRFRSDEKGAFLVLFGVIALVLTATAGAVVDFTSIEQARTRAQIALDAAALALQPSIYVSGTTTGTIMTAAKGLLLERINDSSIVADVTKVTIKVADGQLRLEASIKIPTAFVSLVGIPDVTAHLVSEATRKRLNIEVAMVLDNSGSMSSSSRMTNLKTAANSAIDILFAGAATQPNVFIGVVPFTEFVNVGTANANASWMDTTGIATASRQNFDNDDNDGNTFSGPLNRFAIYSAMSNTSWKGCVEARMPPYDVTDEVPTASAPDTLFVPELAPDEPGTGGYSNNYISDNPAACIKQYGNCTWKQTRTKCNSSGSSCTGPTTVTSTYTSNLGANTTSATACTCASVPALAAGADTFTVNSDNTTSTGSGSNRTRVRTMTCNFTYQGVGLSDRELQERVCKYTGQTPSSSQDGPNVDCFSTPLLPLNNTTATVKAKIAAMSSGGGTNIHQGVMWGFHMLSPTAPLTEGKAYDAATFKVMIVMTDGENTAYTASNMDGLSYYMPYNYPFQGRWTGSSATQLQASMDTKTDTTCTNAKTAGITIYTIGLATDQTSNPTQTKALLTNCASDPAKAYFPAKPSDLDQVFKDIATQLSDLRLAL